VARWIFSFAEGSARPLEADEVESCRRQARTARKASIGYAVASILIFLGGLLGIALASTGRWYCWLIGLACLIAFFYAVGRANSADRTALLWRRCARLGQVTRFHRSEAPHAVRWQFCTRLSDAEDGWDATWWDADEKFEQMLRRYAGRQPDWIELVAADDVIYSVEGVRVTKAHDVVGISLDQPLGTVGDPDESVQPSA
jgi:hypothetical protein